MTVIPSHGFLNSLERIVKKLRKDRKEHLYETLEKGKGVPSNEQSDEYLKKKFSEYIKEENISLE